jgi:branched-chain amino acid transport system substrate-binding protein
MKKNKIYSVAIVLAVCVGMFFAGCGEKKKETIKIGAILPLTGNLSAIGTGEKKGIELAYDSIKKLYPDKEIVVIFEDFKSDTKLAVSAANKLISTDKVQAIITSTTAASEAVSPIVERNKIIHFVIAPDAEILKRSQFNYRIYYNYLTEAKIVNEFINIQKKEHTEYNSISFLAVSYSSIQKEIDEIIEPHIKNMNFKTLSKDYFDINTNDFKLYLSKIKSLNPNYIFLAPQVHQVIGLSDQLRDYNIQSTNNIIICGFTYNWVDRVFINTLENFFIVSPKCQIINQGNLFQKMFISKYGHEANFDMLYAYDNFYILADLLVKINDISTFEEKFNTHVPVNGASGIIHFIGNRDTDPEIILTHIVNGIQVAK